MCRYVLDQLWAGARNGSETRDTDRAPIFIVVDEAHRLIPSSKPEDGDGGVREAFKKIAAEGRKEGLFLVVCTQRPRKVHEDIVSECENLCLMKLTARNDVDWLADRFSFVGKPLWARLSKLKLGQAVFAGPWSPEPLGLLAEVAARRTREGDGNLDAELIG